MFRVYYLVRTIEQVKVGLSDLARADVGKNQVHVLARDNSDLARQGIHATTPWEDSNILRTGFFGALIGASVGLLAGLILAAINPWGVQIGFLGVLLCVVFFGAHGAWAGGLRGISHDNDHLRPYLKDIRRGRYLILVDTLHEEERQRIHQTLDRALNPDRQDDDRHFNPML